MKEVKSKNKNRMADEALVNSLRLATTNILELIKERQCQRSLALIKICNNFFAVVQ